MTARVGNAQAGPVTTKGVHEVMTRQRRRLDGLVIVPLWNASPDLPRVLAAALGPSGAEPVAVTMDDYRKAISAGGHRGDRADVVDSSAAIIGTAFESSPRRVEVDLRLLAHTALDTRERDTSLPPTSLKPTRMGRAILASAVVVSGRPAGSSSSTTAAMWLVVPCLGAALVYRVARAVWQDSRSDEPSTSQATQQDGALLQAQAVVDGGVVGSEDFLLFKHDDDDETRSRPLRRCANVGLARGADVVCLCVRRDVSVARGAGTPPSTLGEAGVVVSTVMGEIALHAPAAAHPGVMDRLREVIVLPLTRTAEVGRCRASWSFALFCGPPGCGKSRIVEACCRAFIRCSVAVHVVGIDLAELLSDAVLRDRPPWATGAVLKGLLMEAREEGARRAGGSTIVVLKDLALLLGQAPEGAESEMVDACPIACPASRVAFCVQAVAEFFDWMDEAISRDDDGDEGGSMVVVAEVDGDEGTLRRLHPYLSARVTAVIRMVQPAFDERAEFIRTQRPRWPAQTVLRSARLTAGFSIRQISDALRPHNGEPQDGGISYDTRTEVIAASAAEGAEQRVSHPVGQPRAWSGVASAAPMLHGIDQHLAVLRTLLIAPLMRFERVVTLGLRLPKGALVLGPSGCGKTALLLATAHEVERQARQHRTPVTIRVVDATSLLHKEVGVSEKNVASLFSTARASSPCVLLLDNLDAIAAPRGRSQGDTSNVAADRLLSSLLVEMDGYDAGGESRGGQLVGNDGLVMVLATAPSLESLDPAVYRSGRLDVKIQLHKPGVPVVRCMLDAVLRPLRERIACREEEAAAAAAVLPEGGAAAQALDVLATSLVMQGASFAEVAHVAREIVMAAVLQHRDTGAVMTTPVMARTLKASSLVEAIGNAFGRSWSTPSS